MISYITNRILEEMFKCIATIIKKNKEIEAEIPEIKECFLFKDLPQLHEEYAKLQGSEEKTELTDLLLKHFNAANDRETKNMLLDVIIQYHFRGVQYITNIQRLFIVYDDSCLEKHNKLKKFLIPLHTLLNQVKCALNTCSTEQYKNLLPDLKIVKKYLKDVFDLFFTDKPPSMDEVEELILRNQYRSLQTEDEVRLANLFVKSKAYKDILACIILFNKTKLEGVQSLLERPPKRCTFLNEDLLKFYRKVFAINRLCNNILIIFAKLEPKARP